MENQNDNQNNELSNLLAGESFVTTQEEIAAFDEELDTSEPLTALLERLNC